MRFKRILSAITAMVITAAAMPAAVTAAQPTDAKAMEKALTAVKQRVDIPAELTDLTTSSQNHDGRMLYRFYWTDEANKSWLAVICDESGRINSYSKGTEGYYINEQKLPLISKEDARAVAEAFLAKIAPETVEKENDHLLFNDITVANNGTDCTVYFLREKDGVPVVGDDASVRMQIAEDGEIQVSNAGIGFSYDTEFEEAGEEIAEPEAKYEEAYPAEMVYRKKIDYAVYRETGEYETQLVYRVKDSAPGYISAYTGEIVEQKFDDYGAMNDMAAAETAASGGGAPALSKEELAELETIAGLYTVDEAEKFLKSVPQLKIPKSYTVTNSGMYTSVAGKGDNAKKDYSLSVNMSDADNTNSSSRVLARFDAQRDRLIYYYSNYRGMIDPDGKKLTDKEIEAANKDIDTFLQKVLPDKIAEFKKKEYPDEEYAYSVPENYTRMVNGIPYLADTINVIYNAEDKKIGYYSLDYDDDAVFDSTDGALDAAAAYGYLKQAAPIKKYYIYDGEKYRLVYGMDGNPMVDAFTGEDVNAAEADYSKIEYDDIGGHWCEEAVTALADYGIGLPGDSFKPDAAITQSELLRLLISGIEGKYFINYDDEEIYDYCFRNKILGKDERNDSAAVPRELAFVYMIRLAGYEKVAALSDIYKVEYADGGELSDGLIGYAAILSGMGIVAGDGGYLRPRDNTTRAETAMMLYRYMK